MRIFQIVLFASAVLISASALFFIGADTGDVLWRAGVSVLLVDTVWILLWPEKKTKD